MRKFQILQFKKLVITGNLLHSEFVITIFDFLFFIGFVLFRLEDTTAFFLLPTCFLMALWFLSLRDILLLLKVQ